MAGRRLPAYRDPDTAYTRPATNGIGSVGWARTIAHDIAQIKQATAFYSNRRFTPSWIDVTGSTWNGHALQVGQIAYVWAGATPTSIGTAGAGLTLPLAAADSVLPMLIGQGSLFDASASMAYPFVCLHEAGAAMFYWADAATDGAVINGDPVTLVSGDSIQVYLSYRVNEPPEGRLRVNAYKLDEEYPD